MRILQKIILIVFLYLIAQFSLANPNNIPLERFFENPDYSGLTLSPDGKYIALISPVNERRNLVVMETNGLKNARPITGLKKQNVGSFFWANNKDIVFTMDSDGKEAISIYTVDTSKKRPKIGLLVGAKVSSAGIRTASVVHQLPKDPNHIIVQFNSRNVKAPDLYKLPIHSRWSEKRGKNPKMKLIAKNPGDVQSWLLDHDGDVRGAVSLKGVESTFYYKNKGDKEFTALRKTHALDESISPLVFDYDNQTLFVTSNIGRDRRAIYKFDPKTNKLGEMIFSHDTVDVSNLIMSDRQKKMLAVTYVNQYPEVKYFDKESELLMKGLTEAFEIGRAHV